MASDMITEKDTENHPLSGAHLKDQAKGILEGNYRKPVTAILLIGVITLAAQLIVEYLASFFFSATIIAKELSTTSLTPRQLVSLMEQTSYLEEYAIFYAPVEYIAQAIASVFTSVFNAGFCLICLNLACGGAFQVSDIFYGFRNQRKKALGLSAIFVLIGQCYQLPIQVLSYLIQNNGTLIQMGIALCGLCIGLAVYIPVSLAVSQAWLLLLDVPEYDTMEIIKLSIRIMQGQKLRLFLIQLSFIPLILLSFLSIGIGSLWLTPYMEVTHTLFFLDVMRTRQSGR